MCQFVTRRGRRLYLKFLELYYYRDCLSVSPLYEAETIRRLLICTKRRRECPTKLG